MSSDILWLRNARSMRLATYTVGSLVGLVGFALLFFLPTLDNTLLALLVIVIGILPPLYVGLNLAPWRIGIAPGKFVVRWLLRPRLLVDVEQILGAVVLVERRYLSRDPPARLFSLHIDISGGRKLRIGALDGLVLGHLAGVIPAESIRMRILEGTRVVEERLLGDFRLG